MLSFLVLDSHYSLSQCLLCESTPFSGAHVCWTLTYTLYSTSVSVILCAVPQ